MAPHARRAREVVTTQPGLHAAQGGARPRWPREGEVTAQRSKKGGVEIEHHTLQHSMIADHGRLASALGWAGSANTHSQPANTSRGAAQGWEPYTTLIQYRQFARVTGQTTLVNCTCTRLMSESSQASADATQGWVGGPLGIRARARSASCRTRAAALRERRPGRSARHRKSGGQLDLKEPSQQK